MQDEQAENKYQTLNTEICCVIVYVAPQQTTRERVRVRVRECEWVNVKVYGRERETKKGKERYLLFHARAWLINSLLLSILMRFCI